MNEDIPPPGGVPMDDLSRMYAEMDEQTMDRSLFAWQHPARPGTPAAEDDPAGQESDIAATGREIDEATEERDR
jgi:hypothetical protein